MSVFERAGVPALKHRPFAKLLAGAFVSNTGTWMETIAIGVFVTETTGKAGWTGTFAALAYLPTILLSPIGGACADRFDRRRWISRLFTLQTIVAGALSVLALLHHLYLPALALLMLADGCADALLNPAFSATVAELVPQDHLLSARSLQSANYNLARVVGPMLAALVLGLWGPAGCFTLNTISFLAVLAPVLTLKLAPPDPAVRNRPFLGGVADGASEVRRDPTIAALLALTAVVAFLVAPFVGLLPAYAIKVFHQGSLGTALLAASQGAGAMAAAFAINRLGTRWGRRALLERAMLAIGPVAALYWMAPRFRLALVAIFFVGALYMTLMSSLSTALLMRVPRSLQGRIASFYSLTLGAPYALGLIAQGWLGDRFGNRLVPVVAAAVFAGAAVWFAKSRTLAEMDDERRGEPVTEELVPAK